MWVWVEHVLLVCSLFVVATVLNPNDSGALEVCLRSIAADWDKLARQLKMGSDVQDIRRTPGLFDNQGYLGELLNRWLNGDRPTVEILDQALGEVKKITTQKAAVNQAVTDLEEFQRQRGMYISSLETLLVFKHSKQQEGLG